MKTTNSIRKFRLHATDGLIGSIKDFYFDDEKWTLRYFVVRTGSWLMGRDVLISPIAIKGLDESAGEIQVDLTKDKIQNSPSIDTAEPISRQHEREYFQYYGWPYYWGGPSAWGWSGVPTPMPYYEPPPFREPPEAEVGSPGEVRLRSVQEILGYHIAAQDEKIGHVEDFILDDETWTMTDLLVDTRNWLPGKKVLIPHSAIQLVSWIDRTITVGLTHEQIQQAPEYDTSAGITREYHQKVKRYYEQQLMALGK
jgi:sporulation protein YlmC with PRC-barrel domain